MKKPTAVFIGTEEAINKAYSENTKKKLFKNLDFIAECIDKDRFINGNINKDELRKVEYIFSTWGMATLTAEEVKNIFPSLKAVFYAAGTVKYFAKPFTDNGVRIFSAWGANAVPVAEVTVSEIILANKGFFGTLHNGGNNMWAERDLLNAYPGNYNTNIGIIGAGMIGKLVIKMLKAYKLNVFVFDKFLSAEEIKALGGTKVETPEELFTKCRVISNHLANNKQTEGILNKACFDKMGKNAVFINTGRGQQVVEKDLICALKAEPGRAAVLDVTYPEPPEKDSELYTLKNVFLTPHLAGSAGNEIMRMGEYMAHEFELFSDGLQTNYEVTEKMLETMA